MQNRGKKRVASDELRLVTRSGSVFVTHSAGACRERFGCWENTTSHGVILMDMGFSKTEEL